MIRRAIALDIQTLTHLSNSLAQFPFGYVCEVAYHRLAHFLAEKLEMRMKSIVQRPASSGKVGAVRENEVERWGDSRVFRPQDAAKGETKINPSAFYSFNGAQSAEGK